MDEPTYAAASKDEVEHLRKQVASMSVFIEKFCSRTNKRLEDGLESASANSEYSVF